MVRCCAWCCGKKERWQALVAGLTQLGWLAAAVLLLQRVLEQEVLATQIGNWPAPFGITLVADVFSVLMIATGAVIGLAVFLFSLQGLDKNA